MRLRVRIGVRDKDELLAWTVMWKRFLKSKKEAEGCLDWRVLPHSTAKTGQEVTQYPDQELRRISMPRRGKKVAETLLLIYGNQSEVNISGHPPMSSVDPWDL